MRLAIIIAALLLASLAFASTADKQSLESIRDAAHVYLQQHTADMSRTPTIEIGRLDPRLRLAVCDLPLSGFAPPGARDVGNVTVGVRCEGSSPWTVYVSARVQLVEMVLVTNRPLARHQQITEQDLRLEERDLSRLSRGYFSDPRDVTGKIARAPVQAGRVLNPSLLTLPKLVERGQRVVLLAGLPGFEVRSAGQALQDGVKGDVISVKNLSSNRVVEGVVTAGGQVQVPM